MSFTTICFPIPRGAKEAKNSYRGQLFSEADRRPCETFSSRQRFFDSMVGSGTTKDVCKKLDIPCDVLDLKSCFRWLGCRKG